MLPPRPAGGPNLPAGRGVDNSVSPVNLATFRRLLDSPDALAAAVALAPTDATQLAVLNKLRKSFPPDLATAAVETALLRRKAAAKFAHADKLFFTREALEVASGEAVARHRAERFCPYPLVGDFGCGVGADTLALAAVTRVHAVDRDELRTAMTAANLAACGLADRVTVRTADLLTDPLPDVPAAFADPGRRTAGRRFLSLADYLPPPAELLCRLPPHLPVAFKLAPGVALDELAAFDAEAEFISHAGELKECVLWLSGLRTARRRATVIAGGTHTLSADAEMSPPPPEPIREVLLDPNAAVVRAGLVPLLAERLNASATDHTVQMLSADAVPDTPFANAYRVEVVLPADVRTVAAELRKRNVGRVTPLVRGSLLTADEFVKGLKLKGGEHRVLVLTRQVGRQVAVVAERT